MNARRIIELLGKNPDNYCFDDFLVRGLSVDSREVGTDYCFVAVDGEQTDGHNYIKEALQRGARVIVYQKSRAVESYYPEYEKKAIFVGVDNSRLILGKLAAEFFNNPAKKIKNIGITGTNGKTTVSFLIEQILQNYGLNPGVIGTICYKVADHILPAKNTTPDAIKLHHLFLHMVEHKMTHALIEVSSHALDQFRTEEIEFKIAVFTNLTHDHLDYHLDIERYFSAKARLFTKLDRQSFAVINVDDEKGRKLRDLTPAKVLDYGIENQKAAVRAENIRLGLNQTQFTLITPSGKIEIKTRLIGRHNIYNILAGICVGLLEKVSLESMQAAVEEMRAVPGRLERIQSAEPFEVFVDYAHTEDALKNVLTALKELRSHRIITVFGCGGDRDKKKRPLMGKVTSQMSDFLVITNDNPRSEKPESIIADIKSGFGPEFKNYKVILNRRQAIAYAIAQAEKKDFVLIAGKGHETQQIFKDKTISFDDRKVASEILKSNQ